MIKKVLYLVAIVLFGVILSSLGRQIYDSLEVGRRLDKETEDLVKLQRENSELKKQLTQVQSVSFIEQQARDNLNFSRQGETVMVIPQEEVDKILNLNKTEKSEPESNWRGWLRLFVR
jgi:cell division protein FtsB